MEIPQDLEFYNAGGITAELHGRTKTTDIGSAVRQISYSTFCYNDGE